MRKAIFDELSAEEVGSVQRFYHLASIYEKEKKPSGWWAEKDDEKFIIWESDHDGVAVADANGNWVNPKEMAYLWEPLNQPGCPRKFHEWCDKEEDWYTIYSSYQCKGFDDKEVLYVYSHRDRRDQSWYAAERASLRLTRAFLILQAASELE